MHTNDRVRTVICILHKRSDLQHSMMIQLRLCLACHVGNAGHWHHGSKNTWGDSDVILCQLAGFHHHLVGKPLLLNYAP